MAFLAFGLFGTTIGLVVALLVRRRPHAVVWTALGAFVLASAAGLLTVFVLGFMEAFTKPGSTLADSVLVGLGSSFLLMFVLPFVCGGPAVVSGVVVQYWFQRRANFRASQPPPLSGSSRNSR